MCRSWMLLFLLFAGCSTQEPDEPLALEVIASGLQLPVGIAAPPGDHERLFVVEQRDDAVGRIRIVSLEDRQARKAAFLELPGIMTGYEEGLLGLAFHPDYTGNGYFFIYYTATDQRVNPVSPHTVTRVERYEVSADDRNRADPQSATIVLSFPQPSPTHNGGWIGFGPDGFLYVAIGDGTLANEPSMAAQMLEDDPRTEDTDERFMGKLLRVDVDRDDFPNDPNRNYGVPADNPFAGTGTGEDVWALGLRNPWRVSFDRETGDIWIGDVGNVTREEINVLRGTSTGGENYGWPQLEGTVGSNSVATMNGDLYRAPVLDYGREVGMCVTGGFVYRGNAIPWLRGSYVYGDYALGWVRSFRYEDGELSDERDWTERLRRSLPEGDRLGNISSFGEDAAGELYVVDFGGEIYRIVEGQR